MIDLIRDGLTGAALQQQRCGGDCAVWRALVATAASARQRGWDRWEWEGLLEDPQSRLGIQAKIERRRTITERRYRRRLVDAWDEAERWLDTRPTAWTHEQILEHIADVRTFVADAPLTDAARRILEHACDRAEKYGTTRPALPWRETAAATGLTHHSITGTHAWLDRVGLLILTKRGYAGKEHRKANLYRLPSAEEMTAYLYRVPRSMADVPRSMDDSENLGLADGQVYGRRSEEDMANNEKITLTFTGTVKQLRELVGEAEARGVSVESPAPAELPDNVRPIRRAEEEGRQ